MIYNPLNHYEGNLAFSPLGDCFAIYKLKMKAYNFLSKEKVVSHVVDTNRFLQRISDHSKHIKILGKPVSSSLLDTSKKMKKTFRGPLVDVASYIQDEITDYYIERRGNDANDNHAFVIIKLNTKSRTGYKDIFYQFDKALNLDGGEIPVRYLMQYRKAEEELFQAIKEFVYRTNELTTEWLCRQPFYRGLGETVLRSKEGKPWTPSTIEIMKHGESYVIPKEREILTLFDGTISHNTTDRFLTIDTPKGKSVQAFGALSSLKDIDFFNGDWIYYLRSLPFSVEWAIDINLYPYKTFIHKVRHQKNKTSEQISHTSVVKKVPDYYYEQDEDGAELEAYLDATRQSYTLTKFDFCITADDLITLEKRKSDLRNYLDDFGLEIQFPVQDQKKLFMEFFPCTEKSNFNYSFNLPTETVSGYSFNTTDELGDTTGFVIGTTGILEKPVMVDPRRASLVDKTPSMVSVGGLGTGKSLLAKFIGMMNALSGGLTLIIDPKSENGYWPDHLPFLKDYFEQLILDGSLKNKGLLDPFVSYGLRYKTGVEREIARSEALQLATSLLAFLVFAKINDDIYTCISDACLYAADHEIPCMERVIEFCETEYKNRPDCVGFEREYMKLMKSIKTFKQFPTSSLLFSDGISNDAITVTKPITILQINGLKIPKKDAKKEDYTIDEVASLTVALGMISVIHRFAFNNRNVFCDIVNDERWFMGLIPSGQKLVEEIMRQGRTIYTGIHLIDQNASGISSEERNWLGLKFVNRTESKHEIQSALELLGLEATPENYELIEKMPEHHTLMQDMEGRVGLVKVDLVLEEFKKAFSTKPVADNAADMG